MNLNSVVFVICKQVEQVNLSKKNGARSHVRAAQGQETDLTPFKSVIETPDLGNNLSFRPDAVNPAFCSATARSQSGNAHW